MATSHGRVVLNESAAATLSFTQGLNSELWSTHPADIAGNRQQLFLPPAPITTLKTPTRIDSPPKRVCVRARPKIKTDNAFSFTPQSHRRISKPPSLLLFTEPLSRSFFLADDAAPGLSTHSHFFSPSFFSFFFFFSFPNCQD